MSYNIIKGIGIFSASAIASTFGYHIRTNFVNENIKEIGATLEVGGHLISYVFYGDAFKDAFIHAVDGELIARLNYNILRIEPVFIPLPNNPITGEVLLDDIEATVGSDYFQQTEEYIGPYKYLAPCIIGRLMLGVKEFVPGLFDIWEKVAGLPELLPAHHTVGLMSNIFYNLSNLPDVGQEFDESSGHLFSHIYSWAQYPGGDTNVGNIYNDYILNIWEKIHRPHHFYEEIESLDKYLQGKGSPLTHELKGFAKDFGVDNWF